jgi:hypothetical protein
MDRGTRIRQERQNRSWTTARLAELSGVPVGEVEKAEQGLEVSPETLARIAAAFGLSASVLQESFKRNRFDAPWNTTVKVVTGLCLMLAMSCAALIPVVGGGAIVFVSAALVGVVALCFLLSVRGYVVRGGQLVILRAGWEKRFDLALLRKAEVNPHAMLRVIRLFGIGGLFGYIGWFSTPVLGRFRAYVTDPGRAVVLDFAGRHVVVTPDDPREFVALVREAARGASPFSVEK